MGPYRQPFDVADSFLKTYLVHAGESRDPWVDLANCSLGVPCSYLTSMHCSLEDKIKYIGEKLYFLEHNANAPQKEECQIYVGKILHHLESRDFTILKGNAGCGKTTLSEEIANLYISEGKSRDGLLISLNATPTLTEERLFGFRCPQGRNFLGPVGYMLKLAEDHEDRRFVFILNEYNRVPHFLSIFGSLFECALHAEGPNRVYSREDTTNFYKNPIRNYSATAKLFSAEVKFPKNLKIILTGNPFAEGYRSACFDIMRDGALRKNRLFDAEFLDLNLDNNKYPGVSMKKNFLSYVEACCQPIALFTELTTKFNRICSGNIAGNTRTANEILPAKWISQALSVLGKEHEKLQESILRKSCKVIGAEYPYPVMLIVSDSGDFDFSHTRKLGENAEYMRFKTAMLKANVPEEYLAYMPCFPVKHEDISYDLKKKLAMIKPNTIIFISADVRGHFLSKNPSYDLYDKSILWDGSQQRTEEISRHILNPFVCMAKVEYDSNSGLLFDHLERHLNLSRSIKINPDSTENDLAAIEYACLRCNKTLVGRILKCCSDKAIKLKTQDPIVFSIRSIPVFDSVYKDSGIFADFSLIAKQRVSDLCLYAPSYFLLLHHGCHDVLDIDSVDVENTQSNDLKRLAFRIIDEARNEEEWSQMVSEAQNMVLNYVPEGPVRSSTITELQKRINCHNTLHSSKELETWNEPMQEG